MKRTLKNVEITELHPDNPGDGDRAYRLITWLEVDERFGSMPCYELYIAEYEFVEEEPADLENGPCGGMEIGSWSLVAECGGGLPTIEEAIAEYQFHLDTDGLALEQCDANERTCQTPHCPVHGIPEISGQEGTRPTSAISP